jgi:hypothetical protein
MNGKIQLKMRETNAAEPKQEKLRVLRFQSKAPNVVKIMTTVPTLTALFALFVWTPGPITAIIMSGATTKP